MNIAFRVDVSGQIGTGHFMRCLTLADALKHREAFIRFICRDLPEHFQQMLTAKGHEFILLAASAEATDNLAHASWLGTSQMADARATIHALADKPCDWLIVDHYALDECWETRLRQTAKKIMAIDDIADRRHDCDLLLDQNFYADMDFRYLGKVPQHCRLLLGPRYALLRDEFRNMRESAGPRTGDIERILVFFGGVDRDNYTSYAIEALSGIEGRKFEVDVVIGAQHPCRAKIEYACAKHEFSCHVQTDKMAELMHSADLAIGAGGGALWERCALGLPALTLCTASNQENQVKGAASSGLVYFPDIKENPVSTIRHHAITLMENDTLRTFLSSNGQKEVDGCGALRVCRELGCHGIHVRKAVQADSVRLFEWRNHPSIRAVSRNTDTIEWESHRLWFESVMNDPDKMLLIGERDGLPMGVVRFDIRDGEAEISIYLVPGIERTGADLLPSAENWLHSARPDVKKIRAHVLGDNERSIHLFSKSGYHLESASYVRKLP
jgi:UDP-2,4-diacetamido-2,4,6-trideoxy-beta-L-altropyranose hydrolase